MAAETFVFNIAQKVLEKLGSLAFQEARLIWGAESDLGRLEKTLSTVKAVLLDAEEQQVHNQELTVWLGQLKEVFYDAQDVLDEFECEALRRQVVEMQGSTTREVRRFFSSSNSLVFRTKMAHKVKEIRARLDEVAADRAKFHNLSPRSDDRHVVRGREMSYSFVQPSDVIGRDQDKEKIVEYLMDPSDGQSISVVPVVGIGGLGKTALAKLVFNDERVIDHFELKCWVCVSDEFVLKQLLVKIIKSITSENRGDLDEEQLQVLLRNNLDGKKFFLVLDDVWNEDRGKWIELRNLLMGGANGSKILVTTRSPTIASMMGTMSPYNLEGLLHQECLSLFIKWAFDEGKERQHTNLVEIGDAIVKKCKGVPLAVKSLGSLLYSKLDERDWLFVRDNEMWKLNRKEGDILSVLQLSYNQMPSYLKQCFALLSLLPKDYNFNTFDLIPYWMANGLLQSPNENQELEDIGNQYIDELYSRCFLEDYIDLGFMRTFKIHDIAHDLALSSAQSDCLIISCQIQNISGKVWHLSYTDNTWQNENVLKCLQKSKSLRSILFTVEGVGPSTKSFVDLCLSKFRYLRVLDLSDSSFEVLPSSIGTMKHLRLLDLTNNCRIHKLPNSICKLQNLQTLKLHGCEKIEELPKDIRYLIKLRTFSMTTKQKCLPGCSNSLRALGLFNCGNLESLVETMQVCTSLRFLVIVNCGGLISLHPNLKLLTMLEALGIENCEKLDLTKMEDNQDNFPTSLRLLRFTGLPQLVAMPDWIKRSAKSLQILDIQSCPNLTALPEWLVNLESLRQLAILNCHKLSCLSKGKLCLPALRSFRIAECPELIRRCQPEIGEDWHKIAHASEIYLDYKRIK
ncbi:putative disease resistance protein RGA4 [Quercus robur]|uniref:putative disease resistance protein RGA4 n=1 Tax=Quercus robur TaxID=38942 RepID=UPI0021632313|nr:putative disease resistance protein RGA4 [Quercus robur]